MAENRLTGVTIELTEEQRRLLRQLGNEDYSELVLAISTPQQQIPNQYGKGEDDSKLVNVLYETNADMIQRVAQNPVIKREIEENSQVAGYFLFGQGIQNPSLFSSLAGPHTTIGTSGLFGIAAAW